MVAEAKIAFFDIGTNLVYLLVSLSMLFRTVLF